MIITKIPQQVNAPDFLNYVANNGRGKYTPKQAKSLFDNITSDIIRASNKWQCRRCKHPYDPTTTELHHANIIERKHKTTRWLFDNGIALCINCHAWFDEIRNIRTSLILRSDYDLPQMKFLLEIGYEKQDLVGLALKSQENWDHDYALVAIHLLGYAGCL